VGKTETAKALASWLKDYGYDSLRIDANQFSDRESVLDTAWFSQRICRFRQHLGYCLMLSAKTLSKSFS
jgi:hypothetical protein